jgi:hypothetical protein
MTENRGQRTDRRGGPCLCFQKRVVKEESDGLPVGSRPEGRPSDL